LALSVAPLPARGAFPVERWPDALHGRCDAEGGGASTTTTTSRRRQRRSPTRA